MPRKGENIYKRKDGRWEGRYIKRRNGKKAIYGYVYAKNYSEVKRKLNLKRTETIQEIKLEKTLQKDISFTTIAKFWLMSIKPSVKESTWIKYRNTLNCQIIPRIGVKNISEIDYETVFGICSDMLSINKDVGKGLSSKTVSDALSIIKAIIKYAERMKFITDRTALDVSVKLKTSQLRVFSHVEEQILFEYLSEKLDYTNLGILICMFTGIRIGELCSLTWEDISLESNTIHIHKTMQRIQTPGGSNKTKILIAEPKSQCSIREIPITKTLKDLLKLYRDDEGYVLTGKRDIFVEPRTMQNRYKTILKTCGISNANFHTLRHTFATRCIEVGFDIKSLSEILGHANVSITLNRYVHPSMELKQKNIDKLSCLYAVE